MTIHHQPESPALPYIVRDELDAIVGRFLTRKAAQQWIEVIER